MAFLSESYALLSPSFVSLLLEKVSIWIVKETEKPKGYCVPDSTNMYAYRFWLNLITRHNLKTYEFLREMQQVIHFFITRSSWFALNQSANFSRLDSQEEERRQDWESQRRGKVESCIDIGKELLRREAVGTRELVWRRTPKLWHCDVFMEWQLISRGNLVLFETAFSLVIHWRKDRAAVGRQNEYCI